MGAREQYWGHVEDKVIIAIEARPSHPHLPGRASFSHINFYVDGYRLSLTTNIDTDEIVVAVESAAKVPPVDPTIPAVLQELIGRSFGWLWSAVNSQGYADMLVLAFDGSEAGAAITPQIGFCVVASDIQVYRIASADLDGGI